MSLEKLKQLVQDHCDLAHKLLLHEPHTTWVPRLTVHGLDNRTTAFFVGVNFNTDEEKKAVMAHIGNRAFEMQLRPVYLVFLAEAWKSCQQEVQPKDDPNRQEVITIFGLDVLAGSSGRAAFTSIDITRDSEGRIIPGTPEQISENEPSRLLLWAMHSYQARTIDQLRRRQHSKPSVN